MKRKVITIVILLIASVMLSYHPTVDARKNPYSGILPPKAKSAVDVNAELMTAEPVGPIYPQLELIINIPARKVTLYDEGREVARHDVAVGQPVFKTPAGPQEVKTIVWNPWWIPPDSPWARGAAKEPPGPRNPLGPVKLLMRQGIRLHGTNKPSSVGRAASHGCLRMRNEEAASLAKYIQKRLNESDDTLFEKYSRNRRRSYWVNLDYPLSVEIVYHPVEVREDKVLIYSDFYRWGKDVRTELFDALMRSGIDLRKINADRIAELSYPKNRYDVVEIGLEELTSFRPREKMSYMSQE